MTLIIKKLILFSFILIIFSCSKSDTIITDDNNTTNDNLDFIVLSVNEDYSSLNQLSVFESGEIIETDLVSEFGGLERLSRIPRLYQIGGELFLYNYLGSTHIKNLRTNKSQSITTLCDISLENNSYHITTSENKIIAFISSNDENGTYLSTIDNNLEQSTCIKLPKNENIQYNFLSPSDFQYSNSKYILFDKTDLASDNYNYQTLIYSYNTESNTFTTVNKENLTNDITPLIVLDEEKFYVFSDKTYKTYDFEFNLLGQGTTDDYLTPIRGSSVVDNKIEVEVAHFTETGFFVKRNVYNIESRKYLISEVDSTEELNTSKTYYKLISKFDIEKERIIHGVSDLDSDFQIWITDFNHNVINQIPIDSSPISINLL